MTTDLFPLLGPECEVCGVDYEEHDIPAVARRCIAMARSASARAAPRPEYLAQNGYDNPTEPDPTDSANW